MQTPRKNASHNWCFVPQIQGPKSGIILHPDADRQKMEAAESLRQKALVGSIATGRAGMDFFPTDKSKGKERQHLVQEEEPASRIVGMRQQGALTKWENVLQRKITWITSTRLCSDMIIGSDSTRQSIIVELTVPWEERMDEANDRKRAKYQELVEDSRRQGWRARCKPLEGGCRGVAGQSLCRVFTAPGLTGEAKRKAKVGIKRAEPWANAAGTQTRI